MGTWCAGVCTDWGSGPLSIGQTHPRWIPRQCKPYITLIRGNASSSERRYAFYESIFYLVRLSTTCKISINFTRKQCLCFVIYNVMLMEMEILMYKKPVGDSDEHEGRVVHCPLVWQKIVELPFNKNPA